MNHRLAARQAHNELPFHHPSSAEYRRLRKLVTEYTRLANEAEKGEEAGK